MAQEHGPVGPTAEERMKVDRLADMINIGLTEEERIALTGAIGRLDEIRASLNKDVALEQAPDREGDHFKVQPALPER